MNGYIKYNCSLFLLKYIPQINRVCEGGIILDVFVLRKLRF